MRAPAEWAARNLLRNRRVDQIPRAITSAAKANAKNPVEETFAGLQLFYARGFEVDVKPTLARFPMRLTSVREYAERVLAG